MTALTDHVLLNAALATAIAPIAYASRWLGRPMLTHTLWLIVLVRLIVPPVWFFSMPVGNDGSITAVALPIAIASEPPLADEFATMLFEEVAPVDPPAVASVVPAAWPDLWFPLIATVWLGVAVTWWGRLIFHAVRFQRLLHYAAPPDAATIALVTKLARRMGLRCCPKVVMVPARLSPCVWCFGLQPTLLLPSDWTARQDRLNRAAVVIHELAHLRRGDHWVRWLELVVTGLFWWLPTVWLARQQLREAEELCCDSWVIATLPAARHAYATALVDMADYLRPLQPALPPLASGFGQVHELKRRLQMILHAKPATRAGRAGAVMALGLGLLLMPVGLVRSQEREQEQPPRPTENRDRERERERERAKAAEERERAAVEREREAADRARVAETRSRAEVDRRDAVAAELKAELAEAQKRLAEAQRAVERIRTRMSEMGIEVRGEAIPAAAGRGAPSPRVTEAARGGEGRGGGTGGGSGGGARGGVPSRSAGPDTPAPREARGQNIPPVPPLPPREPGTPDVPRGPGGGRTTPVPGMPPATPRPADDRVQQLERQLEALRRELEAMRREMRRDPGERRTDERRPDSRPPQP